MPAKSEFDQWFRAQAGPAPCNPAQFQKLRLRVVAARNELERLERQLQAAVLYNKAHQYALCAWCARDPKPPVFEIGGLTDEHIRRLQALEKGYGLSVVGAKAQDIRILKNLVDRGLAYYDEQSRVYGKNPNTSIAVKQIREQQRSNETADEIRAKHAAKQAAKQAAAKKITDKPRRKK